MIYSGTSLMKAFKGDYKPVNIYNGSTKVAGWKSTTQLGESLLFGITYNDTASLISYGRSVQTQTAPSINMFLIDESLYPYTFAGVTATYNNANQTITFNGTSSSSTMLRKALKNPPLPLVLGESYTFKKTVVSGTVTDATSSYYSYITLKLNTTYLSTINESTFVIDNTTLPTNNISFGSYIPQGTIFNNYTIKLQLERGNTANTWVPYDLLPSTVAPIPLSDAGLCTLYAGSAQISLPVLRALEVAASATNYTYEFNSKRYIADSYNPVTGEYIQHIGVKVFDGTQDWSIYGSTGCTYWYTDALPGVDPTLWEYAKCTYLIARNVSSTNTYTGVYAASDATNLRFYESEARTPEELKAWVAAQYSSGTPLSVYYVRSTPVTTFYTPVSVPTAYPTTHFLTDGTTQAILSATAKEILA